MTAILPNPLVRLVMNPRPYSVAWQRFLFESMFAAMAIPADIAVEKVDAGGVPGSWLIPEGAPANRILLYLHGGGYMLGSLRSHAPTVARLARATGARGFLIDYRLAPEFPYPAAVDDARTAWRWLQSQAPEARFVVGGESAGGGLTMALLQAARDDGEPLPRAAFVLSPWADLADNDKSIRYVRRGVRAIDDHYLRYMAGMYVGETDPSDPLISPVHGDLRGLPPLLIHAGRDEAVRGDATRLAEVASEAGVDVTLEQYDGTSHALHALAPLSRDALRWIDRAGSFLSEHLD
jgi:epsilon-lactone hydrolase